MKFFEPVFICIGLSMPGSLFAQTSLPVEPSMPNQKPACEAPEYRQFDFWIGEWEVYGNKEDNKLLGRSRIEPHASGCWISEHWSSASGPAHDGTSLNTWDTQYKVWRQFWVGADASVLRLEGQFRNGVMSLEGGLPNGKGGIQLQRITWTPHKDGSVTQSWDVSDDEGISWQNSFLGIYRRVSANRQ